MKLIVWIFLKIPHFNFNAGTEFFRALERGTVTGSKPINNLGNIIFKNFIFINYFNVTNVLHL